MNVKNSCWSSTNMLGYSKLIIDMTWRTYLYCKEKMVSQKHRLSPLQCFLISPWIQEILGNMCYHIHVLILASDIFCGQCIYIDIYVYAYIQIYIYTHTCIFIFRYISEATILKQDSDFSLFYTGDMCFRLSVIHTGFCNNASSVPGSSIKIDFSFHIFYQSTVIWKVSYSHILGIQQYTTHSTTTLNFPAPTFSGSLPYSLPLHKKKRETSLLRGTFLSLVASLWSPDFSVIDPVAWIFGSIIP